MPCLQHRNTPFVFTSCTRCQAATEVSRIEASSSGEMPALLYRTSMPPKRSAVAVIIAGHGLLVGDIEREGERGAVGAERHCLLGRRCRDIGDADLRALGGEHDRRLATHTAAAAGDHAHLPVKPPRHASSSADPCRRRGFKHDHDPCGLRSLPQPALIASPQLPGVSPATTPTTCPSGSAKSARVTVSGIVITGRTVLPPSDSALSSAACGSSTRT